jgi:hypothetical protein
VSMTATDDIQLQTEEKALRAPPPRGPPTAVGAGVLPPLPPRRPPLASTRVRLVVYLIRRPGLLRTLASGAMVGAFWAITRLGPHPFSLHGVVPMLAGGSTFGLLVAAALRSRWRAFRAAWYPLLGLAGGVAGIVWWLMARPPSAFVMAALLGALLAQGVVAFETWLRRPAA